LIFRVPLAPFSTDPLSFLKNRRDAFGYGVLLPPHHRGWFSCNKVNLFDQ
jgi:hypothetical protein